MVNDKEDYFGDIPVEAPPIRRFKYDGNQNLLDIPDRTKSGRSMGASLRFLATRPQFCQAFGELFWLMSEQRMGEGSLKNLRGHLVPFIEFLDKREGEPVTSTLQITTPLLIDYRFYVSTLIERASSGKYGRWAGLRLLLSKMKDQTPQYLSSMLVLPHGGVRQGKATSKKQTIAVPDLVTLVKHMTKEVEKAVKDHQEVLDALSKTHSLNPRQKKAIRELKRKGYFHPLGLPPDLSKVFRTFFKRKDNFIRYIFNDLGLQWLLENEDNWKGFQMQYWHRNVAALLRQYIPHGLESFVPFWFLISLQSALNQHPLIYLKRDALHADPDMPSTRVWLHFRKDRAFGREDKKLCFYSQGPFGVVGLIQFLLRYTEPLVQFVAEEFKNNLFLMIHKRGARTDVVHTVNPKSTDFQIRWYIEKHKLPKFTFPQLRATAAALMWIRTKSLTRVSKALNHRKVETTMRYLQSQQVMTLEDELMAAGLDKYLKAIGSGTDDAPHPRFTTAIDLDTLVKSGDLSEEEAEDLSKNGPYTTESASCKNPFNSPFEKKKGTLCRFLNMCLFCKNNVVFPHDLQRLCRKKRELLADLDRMTAISWEKSHKPAVDAIDRVLNEFETRHGKQKLLALAWNLSTLEDGVEAEQRYLEEMKILD